MYELSDIEALKFDLELQKTLIDKLKILSLPDRIIE